MMLLAAEVALSAPVQVVVALLAFMGALGTPVLTYLQFRSRSEIERLRADNEIAKIQAEADKTKGESESLLVGTAQEVVTMVKERLAEEIQEKERIRLELVGLREEVHQLRERILAMEEYERQIATLKMQLATAQQRCQEAEERLRQIRKKG